jgi:hypothetical protein
MKLISGNAVIKIPLDVAVCPDCHSQISIYMDGWEEDESGWLLDSFTTSCETEPDIDELEHMDWDESHPSFDMPYVYWLPITEKIKEWVNKEYRFDLS